MQRKIVAAEVRSAGLAEDEVEVIISTSALARDGHVLIPQGCILDNYRKNNIWLWSHDTDVPTGNGENVSVGPTGIRCLVKFAPKGISARADEYNGLAKAGVIKAVSVGFEPLEMEPLDPKRPRGGQRITKWELLEVSWVSVPADTGALVTARKNMNRSEEDWKVGASRSLPIEDNDAWDGAAAEASIFEWAGGDDFDAAKARKGFIFYNAAKPKERGSYKDPIAHVVDGALKVPKGAIRAVASRLPQSDVPEEVKKRGQAVLDHYKKKAGMSDDGDRATKQAYVRMFGQPVKRDLSDVSRIAWMLFCLSYEVDAARFEAAMEGDGSDVPDMLAEVFKSFSEAFLAQAHEEIEEELDKHFGEDSDAEETLTHAASDEERAFIAAGRTPAIRAFRRAMVLSRAGKALSASNEDKLEEADGHHSRALKHHKSIGEHHDAVGEHMRNMDAIHGKASEAHDEMGGALEAARKEPTGANFERCMRAHEKMGDQLDAADDCQDEMQDRHEDVGDSCRALGRSLKSAQRCVRSVLDGAVPGGTDSDSQEVQTSSGKTENVKDAERAFRLRQADKLRLAHAA